MMNRKRKEEIPIRTAKQIRILTSAVSIEIIHVLRIGGPATVGQLGPRLGRKANSLHYHVRKLISAGFIRKTGAGRSGARTEAIYDVTAELFSGPSAPKNPKLRKLNNDAVATILRLAARNFAHATERPADLTDWGKYCNIAVGRYKAWLTRPQLAEVNKHLDALRQIFLESNQNQRGDLCAITVVLTPVDHDRRP
ncbi:MAG: helix-turn-helix domain-containing protein [Phycisphaerales bacterium]